MNKHSLLLKLLPALLLSGFAALEAQEEGGRTEQEAVRGGGFEFQNPENLSTGEPPELEIEDADGHTVTVPLGAPSGSHANLPPARFSEVDHDGDGELDLSEAKSVLPTDVVLLDRNGDGELNFLELQESLPELHIDPRFMNQATAEEGGIGEAGYQALVEALREFNDKALSDALEGGEAVLGEDA